MVTGVIVAVFPTRYALTRALDHLNESEAVDIRRAAVVARAADGETVVLDDDLSADEGGIAGGTLGVAMALFGVAQLGALALPGVGPVIALGAGALVGGIVGRFTGRFAASLLDFGYHNEQIEALAQQLEKDHPALVIEVDDPDKVLAMLHAALKPYGATLIAPLHQASRKSSPSDIDDSSV